MSSPDDDPTDFEGILPVLPPSSGPLYKDTRSNATTGATAAGVRAFTAQAVAFYFRAPVKAFFRTRVDYLAFAKSISPKTRVGKGWSWRATTPGLLVHAIRTYGWKFVPEQLAPPLLANVAVGAALYTSYLGILGILHEPSSQARKTVYPPPSPRDTFLAGFAAGSIQSVIAAPLDALQVRFEQRGPKYQDKTMWEYGRGKLREIGMRGIFAGYGLSFLKDSAGSGVFFCVFEWVKAQGYHSFVKWWYGGVGDVEYFSNSSSSSVDGGGVRTNLRTGENIPHIMNDSEEWKRVVKPHYAMEPAFLMLAGVTASIAQQTILYPLSTLQTLHYERLESLDKQARAISSSSVLNPKSNPSTSTTSPPAAQAPVHRGRMLKAYYRAYQTTFSQARLQSVTQGGMRTWLYRGFWWFTIRQVPSTSAGLVIFELVRRKYGVEGLGDEVRISGGAGGRGDIVL